jgi:NagD protein
MYFIDVQGTLIDDKDKLPIKGSIEFMDKLNRENIPYIIITNNTKKSSDEFLAFLRNLGFDIPSKNYLDPFMILRDIVPNSDDNLIAPFGTDEFKNVLKNLNYNIDYNRPKTVIVSINHQYTNDDYAMMIELLLNGAKLIAMHDTTIYVKDGKRYAGVGSICSMLSFATNKPYEVVGKPSELFYTKAKQMMGIDDFSKITIISDDMKGDIIGAMKLGMRGYLVLSGKIKSEDEIIPTLADDEMPDGVFGCIGDIV